MGRQFAPDEIECLDAVGAFVDHCNARITGVLLNPVFPDVTVTAIYLDSHLRSVVTRFRKVRFHKRRQQLNEIIRLLALLGVLASITDIDVTANPDRQRPATFGKRTHSEQHSPDIRMYQQRICRLVRILGTGQGTALLAVFGVFHGCLVGAFSKA